MEELQWNRWTKFISLQVGPHEKSIITPELKWLSTAFRSIHIKSRRIESKCYCKIQVMHVLYSLFFLPDILKISSWVLRTLKEFFGNRHVSIPTNIIAWEFYLLYQTNHPDTHYSHSNNIRRTTLQLYSNSYRCELYSFGYTYLVIVTQ
jgi:hypothetical protein